MGLVIGLVKFGFFGAIICAVVGILMAPFCWMYERADSAKFAKAQAKSRAESERLDWERRVHNAAHSMMSSTPDHWAPSLILESMGKPGHNERIFNVFHAQYTVEELGRKGLVQGDGKDLAHWIRCQKMAQQEAVGRWYAKEQAIADATAANAAQWAEPEPVTYQSPARMGMKAITTNPKNRTRIK